MPEPIHALHVRGVNEPLGPGISATFLGALDQQKFLPFLLTNLDYGMPRPFAESYELAREEVIHHIHAAPGRVVLSGYSGGSYVIGDLARDIGAGIVEGIPPEKVAAVALLADPLRPEGAGAPNIPTPGGYGIAGQRWVRNLPVFWGTASRDSIAALGRENPLRSVADLSRAFTVNPLGWERWARDMFNTLTAWQVQPWWMFWHKPGRWADAILALNGYLTTAHTADYLTEGVCVALAKVVNEAVE